METIFEYILLPIEFTLLDYVWKTYNLLLTFRFDSINKITNQNNSFLKMKLILHLIILAAFNSLNSLSALKCYNCTEKGFDDFCSSTPNSNSWQIIDCDGSCAEQIQLYHRFSRLSYILIFILINNQ